MAKQVKKQTAKKAPAKAEAKSTAWNAGKTMTLHLCKVTGAAKKSLNTTYRSIWEAYNAILGEKGAQASISQCVRVRKAIKQKKPMRETVELSDGKRYTFEMVARS